MKTNPNDSAHPEIKTNGKTITDNYISTYGNTYSTGGLTKLEYFAAMAMQANISGRWACPDNVSLDSAMIAKASVEYANALITELNSSHE